MSRAKIDIRKVVHDNESGNDGPDCSDRFEEDRPDLKSKIEECTSLRRNFDTLSKAAQRDRKEIQILKKQLWESSTVAESTHAEQIKILENSILSLRNVHEVETCHASKLEQENSELLQEVQTKEEIMSKLLSNLQLLSVQLAEEREKAAQKNLQNLELESKLKFELEDAKKKIEALERLNIVLKKDALDLNIRLNSQNESYNSATGNAQKLQDQISELKKSHLENRLQLEQSQTRCEFLADQLGNNKNALELVNNEIRMDKAHIRIVLEEKDALKHELREIRSKSEINLNLLRRNCDSEVSQLQGEIQVAETNLMKSTQGYEERILQLEESLHRQEELHKSTAFSDNKEISILQNRIVELDANAAETLEANEKAKVFLVQTNEKWDARMATSKYQHQGEIQRLKAENEVSKNEMISNHSKDLTKLNIHIHSLQEDAKDLQTQLNKKDSELSDKDSKLNQHHQMIVGHLHQKLEELEQKLGDCHRTLSSTETEKLLVEKYLEETNCLASSLGSKVKRLEEAMLIQQQSLQKGWDELKGKDKLLKNKKTELGSILHRVSCAQEAMEGDLTCLKCLELLEKPQVIIPHMTRCCLKCVTNEDDELITLYDDQSLNTLCGKFIFLRQALGSLKIEFESM